MPKVSVIVPVYGVEKYLKECVDSILTQTYSDIELILVDDGSPDRSGEICDEYARKDERVRVFHKENGGVSSARNYGIEQATGEWIMFVDSDDYIDRTYLEDFDYRDGYDLFMQGYNVVNNGVVVRHYDFSQLLSCEIDHIIAYSEDNLIINSPCFKLYNTSIIRKYSLLFDANTSYGEDHLFSLLYLEHVNRIKFVKASGYNYRVINGSLTHQIKNTQELVYYICKSRTYGMNIYKKYDSPILLGSYNRRLMDNLKVFIFNCFKDKIDNNNYMRYIRMFKGGFSNYQRGISYFDRLFIFILLNINPRVSYSIFKYYSKIKNQ